MKGLKGILFLFMFVAVIMAGCELSDFGVSCNMDSTDSTINVANEDADASLPVCTITVEEGSYVEFYDSDGDFASFVLASSKELFEKLKAMSVQELCDEYNDGNVPEVLSSIASQGLSLAGNEKATKAVYFYSSGVRHHSEGAWRATHDVVGNPQIVNVQLQGTCFRANVIPMYTDFYCRSYGANGNIQKEFSKRLFYDSRFDRGFWAQYSCLSTKRVYAWASPATNSWAYTYQYDMWVIY